MDSHIMPGTDRHKWEPEITDIVHMARTCLDRGIDLTCLCLKSVETFRLVHLELD